VQADHLRNKPGTIALRTQSFYIVIFNICGSLCTAARPCV